MRKWFSDTLKGATAVDKKRKPRLHVRRIVLWGAVLAAIAVSVMTGIDQKTRMAALEAEEEQLNAELEEKELEKERLEHMIDYAGTDSYVEQVAREVLGWVKEGETKYVAPDTDSEN